MDHEKRRTATAGHWLEPAEEVPTMQRKKDEREEFQHVVVIIPIIIIIREHNGEQPSAGLAQRRTLGHPTPPTMDGDDTSSTPQNIRKPKKEHTKKETTTKRCSVGVGSGQP